jgi:hypothetical protein
MPAIRRLAADVAGYSRLMGLDEAGTAQALREHRTVADPVVARHGGRIVRTTGDGVLIEFGSLVGAVECALALQRLAAERNAGIAGERRMEWRAASISAMYWWKETTSSATASTSPHSSSEESHTGQRAGRCGAAGRDSELSDFR